MDDQDLLGKVLTNPETAHFSKLKYLNRPTATEEEKVAFLNGLFNAAVEAKYGGDWGLLDRYLDDWEDRMMTASAGRSASRVEGEHAWTTFNKPLNQATFAVLTTGGFYEPEQERYDIENPDGDWSFRPIKKSTPTSSLLVAHGHYGSGEGPLLDEVLEYPVHFGHRARPEAGSLGARPRERHRVRRQIDTVPVDVGAGQAHGEFAADLRLPEDCCDRGFLGRRVGTVRADVDWNLRNLCEQIGAAER